MKKWLVFVLGVVTGFVLTIIIALIVAGAQQRAANNTGGNRDGISLMETPVPFNDAESFKVLQVLTDGALAVCEEKMTYSSFYSGAVVYIIADGANTFYDDQIIEVPNGMRAVQIGTYQYTPRQGGFKTVPVICFE